MVQPRGTRSKTRLRRAGPARPQLNRLPNDRGLAGRRSSDLGRPIVSRLVPGRREIAQANISTEQLLQLRPPRQPLWADDPIRPDVIENRVDAIDRYPLHFGPSQPVDGELKRVGGFSTVGLPVDYLKKLLLVRAGVDLVDGVDPPPNQPSCKQQRERGFHGVRHRLAELAGREAAAQLPELRLIGSASIGPVRQVVRIDKQLLAQRSGRQLQPEM